jgi:transposase
MQYEVATPTVEAPLAGAGQAAPMLPLLTRHDIQVLRQAGVPQERVAAVTGTSVRSVRRIEEESPVVVLDAPAPRGAVGRPSKAAPFRADVVALLEEEPDMHTLEVLRRVRHKGYSGGKSAVYSLVAELRPHQVRPVVRFEGLAGEFTQHDFGQVDVRFVDGRVQRVHFFASRLKYSRWVEVTLVPDERVESLVRTLVDHLEAMGGIPLVAVFDRPRTVALEWRKDGTITKWNPTFAQAMLDLGVGVEVCWPYQPQQKGAVENLVRWVKGSFFKPRRFIDEEDLRTQLAAWHVEVNTQRPSRATGIIPAVRRAEERLRPLKVTPKALALRYPVFVGPTAYVDFETHAYAMPAEAMGLPGTLYLYRDRVDVVAGRFKASHARLFGRHDRATLPELRANHVAAVAGKRAKRYLQREHLLALGPVAHSYLTDLVHRRRDSWIGDVEQLHDYLQAFGPALLIAAIERAAAAKTIGAEYVAHFLGDPHLMASMPELPR